MIKMALLIIEAVFWTVAAAGYFRATQDAISIRPRREVNQK